jgi:hypothetical protein
MGLTVNQLRKLRRFESSTAHQTVLLFCPCGAVVAHSLGKTVVVGSIPTTGSRGFRLTLGLLGLMLFISLQPTFIKYHIDGQDLCLHLLTDRYYTSLSIVNLGKVIFSSGQIGRMAAAACLLTI